ncbi:MAG TPA: 16S rRNA (adenine(1518)-N(6)/adenine(1519)-N(6))-dimethyltransferase RsmA [Phycisphaerae bacterium]|nr:16S rRNA (adenine(1518)-N(6)/adenine(1519)-N(6))-dimethyltransferase RsmA [Phycisphaerae bacterium]
MQTATQIRQMLKQARLAPNRSLGQSFLIDGNLQRKLLELAEIDPRPAVLEVGAGTGSLTQELAQLADRVVAVEIDRGLYRLLERNLAGVGNVTLIHADALASKRALEPRVLAALGGPSQLVSNLPYAVATPLVAECLIQSWRVARRLPGAGTCRFDRLTFTVQHEVAERMSARPGDEAYGSVSVIVALLGSMTVGPAVPAAAFWPRPKVTGRMIRIDFDPAAAQRLADADVLAAVMFQAFGQRRKQLGSVIRRKNSPFEPDRFRAALHVAGIDPALRAEAIDPAQYLALANALSQP